MLVSWLHMNLLFVTGPRLSPDTHITHDNIGLEPLAHLRQLEAQRAAGWLDDEQDDGDRMDETSSNFDF